jgi:hypothetical protein
MNGEGVLKVYISSRILILASALPIHTFSCTFFLSPLRSLFIDNCQLVRIISEAVKFIFQTKQKQKDVCIFFKTNVHLSQKKN